MKLKENEMFITNNSFFEVFFIVSALLLSFPVDVFSITSSGLDASWEFALNYFFENKIMWGKDIVFTYGPLGFLVHTENLGMNVFISLIFWFFILYVHYRTLYQLLSVKKLISRSKLILAITILLYVTSDIAPEHYLCYIGLLNLIAAWKDNKKSIWLCNGILAISFYIKFSSFFILLSALLMFLLLVWLFRKNDRVYYTVSSISSIVFTLIAYLFFYDFSLNNLFKYIYGSFQVASGYNSAMSTAEGDIYVVWVVIIVFSYLFCVLISFKNDTDNFGILMILAGPLFFIYKHGFVRSEIYGHTYFAFASLLWVLSIITLFFNWNFLESLRARTKKALIMSVVVILLIPLCYVDKEGVTLLSALRHRIIDFPNTIYSVMDQNLHEVNKLPDQILNEIGDSTVSIYPWEISYAASDDMNYLSMPGVQAYSIYTPYLDHITADFYLNENSPQYIILSRDTIDDRWEFIECPETWRAIKNSYKVIMYSDGVFLLGKQSISLAGKYTLADTMSVNKRQEIPVNLSNGYIKINSQLNLFGIIAKLLWKIPEVKMRVEYDDGTLEEHRIILDNFINGVDLSSVVRDDDTFVDYMNYKGALSKAKKISFSGAGLKYYRNEIKVSFFALGDDVENAVYPVSTYPLYSNEIEFDKQELSAYKEITGNYSIDFEKRNSGYCHIAGWGISKSGNPNHDVYVECDGVFYKANKTVREDVAVANSLQDSGVGFEILLDKEALNYTIYFLDKENWTYFKVQRHIADEIEFDIQELSGYKESTGDFSLDIEERSSNYFRIAGWGFVVPGNISNDVYVECDGIFYKADKTIREDAALAKSLQDSSIGFEVLLNKEVLSYTIYFLDRENKIYFKVQK